MTAAEQQLQELLKEASSYAQSEMQKKYPAQNPQQGMDDLTKYLLIGGAILVAIGVLVAITKQKQPQIAMNPHDMGDFV